MTGRFSRGKLPVILIVLTKLLISTDLTTAVPVDKGASKKSISETTSHHNPHRSTPIEGFMVQANDVSILPPYEPSVNPFLSHIEQGWKLSPVKHSRYKKRPNNSNKDTEDVQSLSPNVNASTSANLNTPLEMDPNRPHFMDSSEAADAVDEYKAFGDEEKDLRDLFQTLFSSDY